MDRCLTWVLALFVSTGAMASPYEVEPNNTVQTAMPMAFGQPIQGNVATITDVDTFSFNSANFTSVRVLYYRTSRKWDFNVATIRVRKDGADLAVVDAYAPDTFTSFDLGVETNQIYTIEVLGCSENSATCPIYRSELYEILVVGLPTPSFESEPNNLVEQADLVSPAAWIFGQHSSKTDDDVYRVVIPGPGQFFAHLTRPRVSIEGTMGHVEIIDGTGAILNAADVYAPLGQARVVLGLTQGASIYIRVKSCSQNSVQCNDGFSTPYQVVLGFQPATPCELFGDGFDCSAIKVFRAQPE